MALAELDPDEVAELEHRRSRARMVEQAKGWLSRHRTIATWMDDMAVAEALLAEGYDYERLRDAGFSLPARGKLVDISAHVKRIGSRFPSNREDRA